MTTKNNFKAKKAIRKITGPISFGEMLYSFRLSNEYSQVAMAEILGISKQELCNIEKSETEMMAKIEKIQKTLHRKGIQKNEFKKMILDSYKSKKDKLLGNSENLSEKEANRKLKKIIKKKQALGLNSAELDRIINSEYSSKEKISRILSKNSLVNKVNEKLDQADDLDGFFANLKSDYQKTKYVVANKLSKHSKGRFVANDGDVMIGIGITLFALLIIIAIISLIIVLSAPIVIIIGTTFQAWVLGISGAVGLIFLIDWISWEYWS